MKWTLSKRQTLDSSCLLPASHPTSHLESWNQRRRRLRFLKVLLIKNSVFFLLNSVTLPQTWSYLQSLQPSASKSWSAWVVSVTALLRLFTSPLAGWLTAPLGYRGVSLLCDVLVCSGGVLWSVAYVAPVSAGVWLLLARLVMALCGGQLELLMTYISRATCVHERTRATALAATSLSVGTVLGPGLLAVFSYIGTEGVRVGSMRFNTFTVSSLVLTVIMSIMTLLSFLMFTDSSLARDEQEQQQQQKQQQQPQQQRGEDTVTCSCVAPLVCLLTTAHSFGATRLHEALLVAMLMELYGWQEARALRDAGLLLLLTSVLAMAANSVATRAAARLGERLVLMSALLCALTAALLGLPLEEATSPLPHVPANLTVHRINGTRQLMPWPMVVTVDDPSTSVSRPSSPWSSRCPVEQQQWCRNSAARLPFSQLTACVLLTGASCTVLFTSCGSLYSRLLPVYGHAVHCGLMGSAANLGRAAYPLLFTALYSRLGPQMTYLTLVAAVSTLLLLTALTYGRLAPPDEPSLSSRPLTPHAPESLPSYPDNTASNNNNNNNNNNNTNPGIEWHHTVYARSLIALMEDLVRNFKNTTSTQQTSAAAPIQMREIPTKINVLPINKSAGCTLSPGIKNYHAIRIKHNSSSI